MIGNVLEQDLLPYHSDEGEESRANSDEIGICRKMLIHGCPKNGCMFRTPFSLYGSAFEN
jgi:hypothetical protein